MMQPLHEQYRPQAWDDVIGQGKAVAKIKALAKRGLAGRAWWFTGQSGTGKTTLARLIAQAVADPFCTDEIDATDLTAAEGALAELHALDPAAFKQAGMFMEMLLQVAREGKRLSSADFGERNGAAKLTESDVRTIRRRHAARESIASLARAYGVSSRTIRDIVRYVTWRHMV